MYPGSQIFLSVYNILKEGAFSGFLGYLLGLLYHSNDKVLFLQNAGDHHLLWPASPLAALCFWVFHNRYLDSKMKTSLKAGTSVKYGHQTV